MTQTFTIPTIVKHLLGVFVVMCAVLLGSSTFASSVLDASLFASSGASATEATPTASAQPCDDGEVRIEVEADDPCSEPCPGKSPEDGGCLDDCQFCSCCSMAAPAALVSTPMGYGLDAPAFRGDLPPPFNARYGGISLRIFKPPRHLSA